MTVPPEFGPLAAVTPGTPGGLLIMLADYGTMSLEEVLTPALELAAGVKMRLGLYGLAADVIDTSPPDLEVSSLNRDHVGQRATVTLCSSTSRPSGSSHIAITSIGLAPPWYQVPSVTPYPR